MRLLTRYVLRRHVSPLLIGFVVITAALELGVLEDYAGLLFTHAVPLPMVLEVLALTTSFLVVMTAPAAALIATLVAFGGLAQDNEITAVRVSGVSLIRILVPPLLCACVLAAILVAYNVRWYPDLNHRLVRKLAEIGAMRPTAPLREGEFVTSFPGYSVLARRVDSRRSRVHDLTIYRSELNGTRSTITARDGQLRVLPDGRTLQLELRHGEVHEMPDGPAAGGRYRVTRFERQIMSLKTVGALAMSGGDLPRSRRERSSQQLLTDRDSLRAQSNRARTAWVDQLRGAGATSGDLEVLGLGAPAPWPRAQIAALASWTRGWRPPIAPASGLTPQWQEQAEMARLDQQARSREVAGLEIEVHKRLALPFAAVVFVLLGAPIGISVRRGGPVAAFMAIGPFFFYYLCLQGGESMAERLVMPAWASMWMADVVLGTIGLVMVAKFMEPSLPSWRLFGHRVTR